MRETQPRDGGRGPIAPVLLWLDALTRHLPCCPSGGPKLLVSSESQDNSALKPERVSIVEVPDRPSIIGAEANLEFRRQPIIDAARAEIQNGHRLYAYPQAALPVLPRPLIPTLRRRREAFCQLLSVQRGY
jgi:hypothetical protein